MGIIIKVFIENNDQEIDIVTLNSDDQKSSSVTITSKLIQDYINSFGKKDFCGSNDGSKINLPDQNNDKGETNTRTKSHGALLDDRLRDSPSDKSVLPNSSLSNVDLDLNANEACNFKRTSSAVQRINESTDQAASNNRPQTERNIQNIHPDNEAFSNLNMVTDKSTNTCNGSLVPVNDVITDTNSDSQVSDSVDSRVTNVEKSVSSIVPSENIVASGSESPCVRESDVKNSEYSSLASLKNLSYNVDDFLDMATNSSSLHNQLGYSSRLLTLPLFLGDICDSPSNQSEEKVDDDSDFEEYFVVEKIAASRLNPETRHVEFLLEAEICSLRKDSWSPFTDSNIKNFSFTNPKCLYIKYPKSFKKFKRRRLYDKPADQHFIFVNLDNVCQLDVNTDVSSSCRPVDDDNPLCDFSSVNNAEDVVVDPEIMLNQACLSELNEDENKTDVSVKTLKDDENSTNTSETSLLSQHFLLDDMILGDQMAELLDSKYPAVSSDDKMNETKTTKQSTVPFVKHKMKGLSYRCPYCTYKTRKPELLKSHLQTHESESYTCQQCGKEFLTKRGLNIHKKIHSNGKIPIGVSTLPSKNLNLFPDVEALPQLSTNIKSEVESSQVECSPVENELNTSAVPDQPTKSTERRTMVKPPSRKRNHRSTFKRSHDDSFEENSHTPVTRLKNVKKFGKEVDLQKCLAETINDIEKNELVKTEEVVQKNDEETYCKLCKYSFRSRYELVCHKENVHKYPVVLIKRIHL